MFHHHSHRSPASYGHVYRSPRPMSRRVRNVLFYGGALLWLSGALWMILHYFFRASTEFGTTPNAWESPLIRIHGIVALLIVFMLGWISGTHVSIRWRQVKTNIHGLVLLIMSIALMLTGYALYYLIDDATRSTASITHQLLGAIVIAVALWHWLKAPSKQKIE